MKEMILILAMQFSQEFNKPIDHLNYRTGDLQHVLIVRGNEIILDEDAAKIAARSWKHRRLKTMVYHATGKALGMDTVSTKNHFMNPKCILKPYGKLKH